MGKAEFVRPTLVAEFTDEAQSKGGETKSRGAAVIQKRRVIAEFEDRYTPPARKLPLLDFVVLLTDSKELHVRGHRIEVGPDAARHVVRFDPREKVYVATFDGTKIVGIYEAVAPPT